MNGLEKVGARDSHCSQSKSTAMSLPRDSRVPIGQEFEAQSTSPYSTLSLIKCHTVTSVYHANHDATVTEIEYAGWQVCSMSRPV